MKFKLIISLPILLIYCLKAQAFDIRKVNDIKIFSKASYEINDTNLVDKEIGKDLLGKGGVVKNTEHHQMVVDDIRVFFENEIDLSIKGIIDSPILGPKGNKEFLIYGQK